ncbi:hypothetical protein DR864_23240 [Runella rosea]|uniref:DUF4488 domain-containing protein n=1 Tax=Runella rosea TaxID=2259595 RepID=A0A344TST2_9BACT|nr:hypothetical protein [Runella rosea]AXE21703.1 hypothetical protein DR864_23240 [Runella rosea]
MKKASIVIFLAFFGIALQGFSQTAIPAVPTNDIYTGKWEMLIIGTPNGDAALTTVLVRKEGKLTGTIIPKTSDQKEEIKISNIEEADGKITLYFTIQDYDVNVLLEKVDDENLKGSMMNMFDVKAKRVK